MIRYYAFATVFVLCVAVLVTGWWHRDWFSKVKLASVHASAPPPAISAHNSTGNGSKQPFIAVAPWALSAVPECLIQHSTVRGEVSYIRAHIPDVEPLMLGQSLHVADCTITVNPGGINLSRGADRMHIPAPVKLYVVGQRLWLYQMTQGVPILHSYEARAPIL